MSNVVRFIAWYEKGSGELVGEETIRIPLEQLQGMFGIGSDNAMYDCFPVQLSQVEALQHCIRSRIDLDAYNYFVEAAAE